MLVCANIGIAAERSTRMQATSCVWLSVGVVVAIVVARLVRGNVRRCLVYGSRILELVVLELHLEILELRNLLVHGLSSVAWSAGL